MTARRSGTLAVVLASAATLLTVLLVAWAASIGPGEVLRGDGPAPRQVTREPSDDAQDGAREDPRPQERPPHDPRGIWWQLGLVLNALAAVALVALLVWAVRRARRLRLMRRRRLAARRALDDAAYAVLDPSVAVAESLLADAAGQRDALAQGTPRNAVVACWHRFERAAAATGIERRPWETSSEHVLRVLDLVDANEADVARLAALYREARFSEHELDEADRSAAERALDAIHRSLRRTDGARA